MCELPVRVRAGTASLRAKVCACVSSRYFSPPPSLPRRSHRRRLRSSRTRKRFTERSGTIRITGWSAAALSSHRLSRRRATTRGSYSRRIPEGLAWCALCEMHSFDPRKLRRPQPSIELDRRFSICKACPAAAIRRCKSASMVELRGSSSMRNLFRKIGSSRGTSHLRAAPKSHMGLRRQARTSIFTFAMPTDPTIARKRSIVPSFRT
jgi:hypothetical protein